MKKILQAIIMTMISTAPIPDIFGATIESLQWRYEYDDAGRVVKVLDPANRETRLAYQLDSNQKMQQLKQHRANGNIVTLNFDKEGRRVRMTDALGTVKFSWKGNNLASVCRDGQQSLAYEWDSLNRITAMCVDGRTIRFIRDFLGRLERIQTPNGDISYEHLPSQGIVQRTLPNGIVTRWSHGPNGRLTEIAHVNKARQILARFTYQYRPDGLIAAIQEWSPQGPRTLRYDYDAMGELIVVTDSRTGYRVQLGFDPVGNRIERRTSDGATVRSDCDPLGRLVRHSGQPCQHDTAGNLIRYETVVGYREFEFDDVNLIKSVVLDKTRVDYMHDGDRSLLSRTCGGETTRFVNDPLVGIWRPLLATDGRKETVLYVWSGDFVIAALSDARAQYFLEDHLGSVRLVANEAGTIVEQCDYDAHGMPLRPASDTALRPGFAGMFYDGVARLYLTRARAYEPELGRFLQVEPRRRVPVSSMKEISLFAYCGNDPVNFTDRDGFEPRSANSDRPYQGFLNHINQVYATFDDGVAFGLGSGVQAHSEILQQAQGRWQVIDTTSSGSRGGMADLYEYAITGGRDWDGQTRRASWSAINSPVQHSAGNHVYIPGDALPLRVDPSAQRALPHNEIHSQGIVSDLTAPELRFDHDYIGIGFRAKFDSNPLEAAGELVRDVGSFARGLVTFGERSVRGQGPFESHDFRLFRNDLAAANKIKPEGTYHDVQIVTRDGTYHYHQEMPGGTWSLTGITAHPTPPTKGTAPASHTIGGGSPPPPGGGSGGSPLLPSDVGGVWLTGASDALRNLGMLKGIALGENGQLILIADEHVNIPIPPLRLNDVVTVFRSVYEHGESPFVSIDPDPQDPYGPTMLIRHGMGTKERYVGWILFESDRIMKAYSLLHDTVSGAPIQSKVPGYAALAEEIAHGAGQSSENSVWERFWIVPSVTRRPSASGELTLLEVPLEVKTQRMVMRNGKLVPAPDDTPSERASAFAKWFTEHYDKIGREALSSPPGTHTNQLVSSLAELRRIALIAAIAERLRDQHVPMPAWMKDYPVEAVSFGPTTPALTVEWTNATASGISKRQIYGGVSLSPSDDRVKTLSPTRAADELLIATRQAIASVPPLTPVTVVAGGQKLQAVALPGDNTRALGACRWREVDLAVALSGGDSLRLEREAHSFFQPRDVFGPGWTMDLPNLEQVRRPIRRNGDAVTFKTAFRLQSPLNTWRQSFEEQRQMPELGGKLFAPNQAGDGIALGRTKNTRLTVPTDTVFCRDGSRMHFGPSGDLVAVESTGGLTKYVRDSQGRLERIEAWRGEQRSAHIQLAYDVRGRLAEARGSDGSQASYRYGNDDRLMEVRRTNDTLRYDYTNGLLARVERDGRLVREFSCDSRGCLQREKREDGTEWLLVSTNTPSGVKIVAQERGRSLSVEEAEFDSTLRPVRRQLNDGTTVSWSYGEGQAATVTIRQTDGTESKFSRSADGRSANLETATGRTSAVFNDNGQLTSLDEDGHRVLTQQWSGDGRLQSLKTETTGLHPEYREDGNISRVLITPPMDGPNFQKWIECRLDESGRLAAISDYAGGKMELQRDASGKVTRVVSPRGDMKFRRGNGGTMDTIETSWGEKQVRAYTADGTLERIESQVDDERVIAQFDQGALSKIVGFDGTETTFTYTLDDDEARLLHQVKTPSNLAMQYGYCAGSRLVEVHCGSIWKLSLDYDNAGRITATTYQPVP